MSPPLTPSGLLGLMKLSGYDSTLPHPESYRNFSYTDFATRLTSIVQAMTIIEIGNLSFVERETRLSPVLSEREAMRSPEERAGYFELRSL